MARRVESIVTFFVTIQHELIAVKVSCGSDAHVATKGFKSRRGRRSHPAIALQRNALNSYLFSITTASLNPIRLKQIA